MKLKNKKVKIFAITYFIFDIIFVAIAYGLSTYIKFVLEENEDFAAISQYYLIYSIIGISLILILFYLRRLYNYQYLRSKIDTNNSIIFSVLATSFIIIVLNYYFNRNTYQLSRIWLIYTVLFSILFIVSERLLVNRALNLVLKKIGIKNNILIIGVNEESKRIAITLQKNSIESNEIIGFLDDGFVTKSSIREFNGFRILGNLKELKKIIDSYHINRIVISTDKINYLEIVGILDLVEDKKIEVQLSPSLFEFSISRVKMFEERGILFIQVKKVEISTIDSIIKYLLDYILGIILFLGFLIILPFIAIFIKADSRGPIFYKQKRYGKNYKIIEIFKFRTMVADADKNSMILNKIYDRNGGFKIREDPRITKAGRFLRKTSLDELPQILNVLKGDLSIVGPRALAIEEGDMLKDWERKRMIVKQGITGLWQVSGRSDLDYEERMKLDLYYIHNWSIWLEIKILFLTVIHILTGKGAY